VSGPDRVVVSWIRPTPSDQSEVRAQALTADGDLAVGWPTDGVRMGDMAGFGLEPVVAGDGSGGAYVAWVARSNNNDSTLRLQHVSAGGVVAAGWPAEGMLLGTARLIAPALAADNAGGVIVGRAESNPASYEPRAVIQRFDASGALAPGWPAEGVVIPNASQLGVLVDTDGHIFVSTSEIDPVTRRSIGVRVQRLTESGAPEPSWPQPGPVLDHSYYGSYLRLFSDGAGGVFPSWQVIQVCVESCDGPNQWAARVRRDGTPDAGWTPPRAGYWLRPDGTGGMLASLVTRGRPSAQRLDAAGKPMPGWAAEGNAAMTEVVAASDVRITSDGRGGAFVAWLDDRTDENRYYASRLDASGRLASGWPSTGSRLGGANAYIKEILTLREDVAVVLFEALPPSGSFGYVMALSPGEPGPIGELRPIGTQVGFGVVQVRPHPARGPIVAMVELPSGDPARLELVDATGRMLEVREFDFWSQARGAVRFNDARTLPAGVYWFRLTQAGRVATKKVVVLE
jgi:hypothetical protein